MRTNIHVNTHDCTLDYFIALINMFPKGEYGASSTETSFWFTFETFTFFLDHRFNSEYREYKKTGSEEE